MLKIRGADSITDAIDAFVALGAFRSALGPVQFINGETFLACGGRMFWLKVVLDTGAAIFNFFHPQRAGVDRNLYTVLLL